MFIRFIKRSDKYVRLSVGIYMRLQRQTMVGSGLHVTLNKLRMVDFSYSVNLYLIILDDKVVIK